MDIKTTKEHEIYQLAFVHPPRVHASKLVNPRTIEESEFAQGR